MADSVFELNVIQMAKQAAFNTAQTTATYNWGGRGSLDIEDSVIQPNYVTGEPGGLTVEDAFGADTGSMFNLSDIPVSPTLMTWLGCMAVKDLSASNTTYLFAVANTTANSLAAFSFKLATMEQVFDVADCFIEEFNLHGDVGANNGQVQVNAKVGGRKAAPGGTKTAALTLVPNHTASILNQNGCGIKIAALGTAASAGTAQTGILQALSLNWKTGFTRGRYSDGRAALDYAQIDGGGLHFDITGSMRVMMSGTANIPAHTHIANARAGTGKNVQLVYTAGNADTLTFALPIVFTATPKNIGGEEKDGMVTLEFPFRVGYSRTATALLPSFTTVIAVGTTVT